MITDDNEHFHGRSCLKDEVPWVTPGAVSFLDQLCMRGGRVLDIGTGGSTLFYARRCAHVTAVETNLEWYKTVRAALEERKIPNVDYILVEKQALIEEILKSMDGFDIVSIDSAHGYSRSSFLDIMAPKTKRVLVLDNYAEPVLFPTHHDKSGDKIAALLRGAWWASDFDDRRWVGRGTRILQNLG